MPLSETIINRSPVQGCIQSTAAGDAHQNNAWKIVIKVAQKKITYLITEQYNEYLCIGGKGFGIHMVLCDMQLFLFVSICEVRSSFCCYRIINFMCCTKQCLLSSCVFLLSIKHFVYCKVQYLRATLLAIKNNAQLSYRINWWFSTKVQCFQCVSSVDT